MINIMLIKRGVGEMPPQTRKKHQYNITPDYNLHVVFRKEVSIVQKMQIHSRRIILLTRRRGLFVSGQMRK